MQLNCVFLEIMLYFIQKGGFNETLQRVKTCSQQWFTNTLLSLKNEINLNGLIFFLNKSAHFIKKVHSLARIQTLYSSMHGVFSSVHICTQIIVCYAYSLSQDINLCCTFGRFLQGFKFFFLMVKSRT